ncbi:hypothetical protein LY78DRAFT_324285 [Colletotrichum sublineola]|nr:hypothetical protein LY78DRAFT_324285 [Colletotrichum sublineola]
MHLLLESSHPTRGPESLPVIDPTSPSSASSFAKNPEPSSNRTLPSSTSTTSPSPSLKHTSSPQHTLLTASLSQYRFPLDTSLLCSHSLWHAAKEEGDSEQVTSIAEFKPIGSLSAISSPRERLGQLRL